MNKNLIKKIVVCLLIVTGLVIVDQVPKILIAKYNVQNVKILGSFLSISYVKNTGAAFSFLADKSWAQTFFITITFLALIAFFAVYFISKNDRFLFRFPLLLIIGGAIGNLIDRLSLRYVRDFISVKGFATFNIADTELCVGAFLLVIYFFFIDKDAIFKFKKKDKDSGNKEV